MVPTVVVLVTLVLELILSELLLSDLVVLELLVVFGVWGVVLSEVNTPLYVVSEGVLSMLS